MAFSVAPSARPGAATGDPAGPEGRAALLAALDWDFADVATDATSHGMHPYPAKFIPQIPRRLIETLAPPGATVADVFCGSGTTLVEAVALGRRAIGVDANPLACLISRAKTTPLNASRDTVLTDLAERATATALRVGSGSSGAFESTGWRPDDENLDFWFEGFVIEELAEVLQWCGELDDAGARAIATTAFSAIVVQVSRQDSDTRYVRRPKAIRPGDTLRRFARSLSKAIAGARAFTAACNGAADVDILCSDVLAQPDIGPIDLVVSSPPYPNAYSYHLYHRTRMAWLEMDQPTFKRAEIGSHRKYSSKSDRAPSIETFEGEMIVVFEWLRRHLNVAGFACFLVGDSTIRGQRFDNADVLHRAATAAGLEELVRIERRLQPTRKAFNPAIGKIKTEKLLVFSRPG